MSDCSIKLINIYAPNNDSPQFFEFVKGNIEDSSYEYCIIWGDLNLVLDPEKDTYNYRNINNPNARRYLLDMMNILCLNDTFRIFNKNTSRYTWHRKNPRRHARLDYFLISDTLLDLVNRRQKKSGYRSDHSILELVLTFCNYQQGRGLWKFNCSLLKNKDYLIAINNVIDR